MPKRLVVGSIRLARGTKATTVPNPNGSGMVERQRANIIQPKIGEVFDFKQEEIDYLNEHAPGVIRHPRNEEVDNASTVSLPSDQGSTTETTGDASTDAGKKASTKKADAATDL